MTEQETIRVLREALSTIRHLAYSAPQTAQWISEAFNTANDAINATATIQPAAAPEQADVRDAERLDWLEVSMASNHKSTPYHDGTGFGFPYLVHGSPMGGGVGFHGCDSLRAAIDAAMATCTPADDSQPSVGDKGQGGAA